MNIIKIITSENSHIVISFVEYLLSAYAMQNTLNELFNIQNSLWEIYYYYHSHLIDEETESQKIMTFQGYTTS